MRRAVLAVLLMAVAAVGSRAADGDNTGRVPGEAKGSPPGGRSYYEGVWVGEWPGWIDLSATQDVTVTIEKGSAEGAFNVVYAWGSVRSRRGTFLPGSVTTAGKEEGDRFVIKWTNKQGRDIEVTLRKHEDDKVKARIDRSGPMSSNERPFNETILKRK